MLVPLLTIISLSIDNFAKIDFNSTKIGVDYEADFKIGIVEIDAELKANGISTTYKTNPYSCTSTKLNDDTNYPFHCIDDNSSTCSNTRATRIVTFALSAILLISLGIVYLSKYNISWLKTANIIMLLGLIIFNGVINNYFYSMVKCVSTDPEISGIFKYTGEIDNLQISSILGLLSMFFGVILMIIFLIKYFRIYSRPKKSTVKKTKKSTIK